MIVIPTILDWVKEPRRSETILADMFCLYRRTRLLRTKITPQFARKGVRYHLVCSTVSLTLTDMFSHGLLRGPIVNRGPMVHTKTYWYTMVYLPHR